MFDKTGERDGFAEKRQEFKGVCNNKKIEFSQGQMPKCGSFASDL